jgi:hypothetical protein
MIAVGLVIAFALSARKKLKCRRASWRLPFQPIRTSDRDYDSLGFWISVGFDAFGALAFSTLAAAIIVQGISNAFSF